MYGKRPKPAGVISLERRFQRSFVLFSLAQQDHFGGRRVMRFDDAGGGQGSFAGIGGSVHPFCRSNLRA